MSLQESYPAEWEEIKSKKVSKNEIDKYLLNFEARLLKEVKKGKRNQIDLGDGFGIGIMHAEGNGYKLNPLLHNFLTELSDYNVEIDGKKGWGSLQKPKEVEIKLKSIAKKIGLKISLS